MRSKSFVRDLSYSLLTLIDTGNSGTPVNRWKPRSIAQRRAMTLGSIAFMDVDTVRDVVLHRASNWLLSSYELALSQTPSEVVEARHVAHYVAQLLLVMEVVGVPLLAIMLKQPLSIESYHLVQRGLSSICGNLLSVQAGLVSSVNQSIPFAEQYYSCLDLGRKAFATHTSEMDFAEPLEFVDFKDVSFSFPKDDAEKSCSNESAGTRTLRNLNFRLERGKVYSIVGKNGCGKTTLVNLLTKLFAPSEGKIEINGKSPQDVDTRRWHDMIAVAPQEFSQLWDLTVHENIGLGQTKLLQHDPEGVIVTEAQRSQVSEFVELDTFVGSFASFNKVPGSENEKWTNNFSGGQWQSIALARTLCRTGAATEMLILDEPSSALDPLAEHRLFERLRNEKENRITIFISHRLQTSRASDCILVVDDGTIVQSGSHTDLMENNDGLYAQLYKLQNTTWHDDK
jgi:ATP-binding cassette, subfamily B, bacterial